MKYSSNQDFKGDLDLRAQLVSATARVAFLEDYLNKSKYAAEMRDRQGMAERIAELETENQALRMIIDSLPKETVCKQCYRKPSILKPCKYKDGCPYNSYSQFVVGMISSESV